MFPSFRRAAADYLWTTRCACSLRQPNFGKMMVGLVATVVRLPPREQCCGTGADPSYGTRERMTIFQVQLWPNGKWDGKDHQKVEAATAKDAAEKLYGSSLRDKGSNYKNPIRAQVRALGDLSSHPTVIYEP